MYIEEAPLNSWIKKLLTATGVSDVHAEQTADVFIRSSRRNIGHHDINDFPGRIQMLLKRKINPTPYFTTISDNAAVYIFDGDGGLGEVCCYHATTSAILRAHEFGIGLASVRHSNHFLAGYPYAQMGTEHGLITQIYTNTDPSMTGPHGKDAIIGNNPIGFGAPNTSTGAPVLLDTSLAYTSIGNLKSLADRNKALPGHWALDSSSTPTTDPVQALEGWRIRPIGEHKGFGLAVMHEILTGTLCGGETTSSISSPGGINTHSQTVIAISTSNSCPPERSFNQNINDLSRQLEQKGARLPGTEAAGQEQLSKHRGISIKSSTFDQLKYLSDQLGVLIPDIC